MRNFTWSTKGKGPYVKLLLSTILTSHVKFRKFSHVEKFSEIVIQSFKGRFSATQWVHDGALPPLTIASG